MNVFDLTAKIGLDKSAFTSGLKSAGKLALQTAGQIGSAMVGMAADITKSSVEAYSDYEQLVGGVETLFGAGGRSIEEYADKIGVSVDEARSSYNQLMQSQDIVMKNAEEAYKTAGLSANEYMETVTSFSASLLQSVGGDTVEAANLADMAIIDMSDNANKMGSDMQTIQNAYQGFAKQNYTMLDNLKLGYGGTKSEMERLVLDAENLNSSFKATRDENGKLEMSYADIVNAIHIVQENMDISGTTAKEASTTIQGSLSSTKAAWQNVLVAMANPDADLGEVINQFIDSLVTTFQNIMPVVKRVLPGVVKLVAGLAQGLLDNIDIIIDAGLELLNELINVLVLNLPKIIEASIKILEALSTGIIENMPLITDAVMTILLSFVTFLIENLPMIIEAALQIIIALALGIAQALPTLIPTIVDVVLKIVDILIDNLPLLIDAAIQIISALIVGIVKALPKLLAKMGEVVGGILKAVGDGVGKLFEAGWHLLEGLWNGISDGAKWLWEKVSGWLDGLWNGILDFFGIHSPSRKMAWVGKMLPKGLANGIDDSADEAVDAMQDMADDIADVDFAVSSVDIPTIEQGNNRYSIPSSNIVPSYAYAGTSGSFNTDDIIATIAGAVNQAVGNISISLYIGQTKFDDMVVQSIQRYNYKSGGR